MDTYYEELLIQSLRKFTDNLHSYPGNYNDLTEWQNYLYNIINKIEAYHQFCINETDFYTEEGEQAVKNFKIAMYKLFKEWRNLWD